MNLEQLKERFQKSLGIVGYQLSIYEIRRLISEIRSLPMNTRTQYRIQGIVTSVTGYRQFITTKALDNSDLDNLMDQIDAALRARGE
jgi:ribosomal protein L29